MKEYEGLVVDEILLSMQTNSFVISFENGESVEISLHKVVFSAFSNPQMLVCHDYTLQVGKPVIKTQEVYDTNFAGYKDIRTVKGTEENPTPLFESRLKLRPLRIQTYDHD